eukprot:CAMPEP_0172818164 /NCGR_PEP_ID=MMETSP1075-20121228/13744_1 /TAXON_ID=2916 /ORGANISM="Ceratium fusus, Strain PA161109" /LENGTH=72 /DNA_ID=CAMNT_0013658493 /DNA_START=85 /DNA_END=299 /DNA_ORIENTATION=-
MCMTPEPQISSSSFWKRAMGHSGRQGSHQEKDQSCNRSTPKNSAASAAALRQRARMTCCNALAFGTLILNEV